MLSPFFITRTSLASRANARCERPMAKLSKTAIALAPASRNSNRRNWKQLDRAMGEDPRAAISTRGFRRFHRPEYLPLFAFEMVQLGFLHFHSQEAEES